MTFTVDLLPKTEIESVTEEGVGRKYLTPGGEWYWSVTTILGRQADKSWKDAWVERIGQVEADRVSGRARRRGNSIHPMLERFVTNDPAWTRGVMPVNLINFRPLVPVIRERLSLVRGAEYPLWSDRLKTAGRTDLIGTWDSKSSIIDLKGSNRDRKHENNDDYYTQAACYGVMLEGLRPDINIEQVVILVMVEHGEPQVFVEPMDRWRGRVEEVYVGRNT